MVFGPTIWTVNLFGSPWFWVIPLSFHHWVSKMRGSHRKKSCWAWFLGVISTTQNSKIWVMDDGNWKQNFGVFSFWNMSYDGKKWVMWPNNNFEVFEIKWGLGYELWVLSLSYEYWVLKIESWPNQTSLKSSCMSSKIKNAESNNKQNVLKEPNFIGSRVLSEK